MTKLPVLIVNYRLQYKGVPSFALRVILPSLGGSSDCNVCPVSYT